MNQIDEKRQTALHHATILGYTDLACLLLKKGADHRRVNTDNKACQFWKFPCDVIVFVASVTRSSRLKSRLNLLCVGTTDPITAHYKFAAWFTKNSINM